MLSEQTYEMRKRKPGRAGKDAGSKKPEEEARDGASPRAKEEGPVSAKDLARWISKFRKKHKGVKG